ncbi:unnamed protein product [Hymenolepis diminuta]|uniref:Uncharacterized protein n=1 Tax=Hymenolepis diminuta TaxID=6216 RepID=A0A0R3SKK3_HYMDI|nr:unnamed protein product [Hymenolepis diminuta]VUZ39918.1 unnamed protein product [Hymenolepis diminuta]
MSEKPKPSHTPTESNFPIPSEDPEFISLTDPIDIHLPIGKMRKLKPLSIEVGNIEERFGPSSESVSTLVGSVTPQGFSPGPQEQSESEIEKKFEEAKADLEKIPQKPKPSPKLD